MRFTDCCLVKVDLGGTKRVTGIATQGKVDFFVNAWTTKLEVWYSMDQSNWYQAFNGQVGVCLLRTSTHLYDLLGSGWQNFSHFSLFSYLL